MIATRSETAGRGSIGSVPGGPRGEDAEFISFFHEVEAPIRRFAERLAPAGLDPEDLAAEGLARAYARWAKVGRLPYRRAWLFRVTANVALDRSRRRATADRRRASVLPPADASSHEDEITRRETLRSALAALPTRQREAVSLRYLGDLSVEETAAAMGVSGETVKTHCERGLIELRRSLGSSWEEVAR